MDGCKQSFLICHFIMLGRSIQVLVRYGRLAQACPNECHVFFTRRQAKENLKRLQSLRGAFQMKQRILVPAELAVRFTQIRDGNGGG
jgi:hypothetical protein